MKNFSKAAIVIVFLAIAGFALTTKNSFQQQTEPVKKITAAEKTRDLYLRNCARCHGADGKSQTELGRSLDAVDLTDQEVKKKSQKTIIKIITDGEDQMPAFGKKISKAEIKALAKYVRKLK